MASRSIICRSRRLRQIIDLRDTDKSRYFAIPEFNNCFIIRSPSLFTYFNHFLEAQGSGLPFFPSRSQSPRAFWSAPRPCLGADQKARGLWERDCHFSFKNVVPTTHEQNVICSKTRLDGMTHEQTIICRQLFAGHVVGSRPM